MQICNHENNVPSRLPPQWLWAHDVQCTVIYIYICIYIHIYIYIYIYMYVWNNLTVAFSVNLYIYIAHHFVLLRLNPGALW